MNQTQPAPKGREPMDLPVKDYVWHTIIRPAPDGSAEFLNYREDGWTSDPDDAISFTDEQKPELRDAHRRCIERFHPPYRVIKTQVFETAKFQVLVPTH